MSDVAAAPTESSQPTVRIIRVAEQVEMPWKNGFGMTREVCRVDDAAGFIWRASLARVERDGPFSLFPGCERVITLLEGAPMRLEFEDGEVLRLDQGQPRAFSCERPLTCYLEGESAASRDFNLIWRRTAVAVSDCALTVRGTARLSGRPGDWHLVVAVRGAARVNWAGQMSELAPGDALLASDPTASASCDLEIAAEDGLLLAFTLQRR